MWELNHKEGWVLKNWCFQTVVLEKSLESPLNCKEIKKKKPKNKNRSILKEINPEFHWKNWCWSWSSNSLATWWEDVTHWRRPWGWEKLTAGGEGSDRGWDGWVASLSPWTWVWANSGIHWRIGKSVCCSPWDLKESDTTLWPNRNKTTSTGILHQWQQGIVSTKRADSGGWTVLTSPDFTDILGMMALFWEQTVAVCRVFCGGAERERPIAQKIWFK